MPDASPYTNRLINETSPYLLQHAHNPVRTGFPWSDEAFELARERTDVPVFLSIGYSTCWCHVMERESFRVARHRPHHERAIRVHQGRP
ncbi:MAG: DUF255 domain-containing protein [Phycisphaerales bacterium]